MLLSVNATNVGSTPKTPCGAGAALSAPQERGCRQNLGLLGDSSCIHTKTAVEQ